MNWHQLMEKALSELKSNGAQAAEPLLQQALALSSEKIEYKAMTYFNFGLVYYDLKRPKEAEEAFAQAIELIQERLPQQNELYGMFLKTMIEFYEKENRLGESKKYYLLEIDHTRNMFGAKHPYVANMTCELADIMLKTGDYAGAEKQLSRALEIMLNAKGPDHSSNGDIHLKLSKCYERLARTEDAAYHKGRAEAIFERSGRKKNLSGEAEESGSSDAETVEQALDGL